VDPIKKIPETPPARTCLMSFCVLFLSMISCPDKGVARGVTMPLSGFQPEGGAGGVIDIFLDTSKQLTLEMMVDSNFWHVNGIEEPRAIKEGVSASSQEPKIRYSTGIETLPGTLVRTEYITRVSY